MCWPSRAPKNLLRLNLRLRQLFRQHLDSERGTVRYKGLMEVVSTLLQSAKRGRAGQESTSHIMSENEKCPSYSLEANPFTDSTQEECESTYVGYKPQNVSKFVTTLGRFHYDGGMKDLPCDRDWSESSVEVTTPMKNQGQCHSTQTMSE